MPLDFLPAGKIFYSLSEGNESLQIYLFDKLAKTMFKENIDDLPYAGDIFICVPES
jgi:hypothetical protein